jgi:hypothetical protein
MFDLAAVGVVNDEFEIDARLRRGTHAQDLVGTHAEVAIGQPAVLLRREVQAATGFVQDDEIVARTLHLGEANAHDRIIGHPMHTGARVM